MTNAKRIRLDCLLYILTATALMGLVIWATMGEIARNPSRETMVELGPYRMVTVQFETDPYPARPKRPVSLNFMLMDSRNQTIEPESFSFEYGRKGSDEPVSSGTVQPMSDGSGMFMTNAQFPSVGIWWLRVNFAKDGYEEELRFTIDVKPAQ